MQIYLNWTEESKQTRVKRQFSILLPRLINVTTIIRMWLNCPNNRMQIIKYIIDIEHVKTENENAVSIQRENRFRRLRSFVL